MGFFARYYAHSPVVILVVVSCFHLVFFFSWRSDWHVSRDQASAVEMHPLLFAATAATDPASPVLCARLSTPSRMRTTAPHPPSLLQGCSTFSPIHKHSLARTHTYSCPAGCVQRGSGPGSSFVSHIHLTSLSHELSPPYLCHILYRSPTIRFLSLSSLVVLWTRSETNLF